MGICEENEEEKRKRIEEAKITLNSSDEIFYDDININEKIKETNKLESPKIKPNKNDNNFNVTNDKNNKNNNNMNYNNNNVTIDTNLLTSGGTNDPKLIYHKIKILGQGSFGTVYLAKNKKLNSNFAMKIIQKSDKDSKREGNLMNEINFLRKLDHPNILKINDFYSTKNEYIIITEFCPEGELFYEIKNFAPFDEPLAAWYMKQILSAVNYCHKYKIIHRDLKPENILISKRNKKGFNFIKIIDFGTAILFNKKNKKLAGSIYYLAPEVISKERNYSEKCDIWSCGIIMYILLTGKPPFNGDSDEEIVKSIMRSHLNLEKYPWPIISIEAKDLLKKLLKYDQNKRISAEDALNHEWFKSSHVNNQDTSGIFRVKNPNILFNNLIKYRSDNPLRCAVIAYLVHNNMQLEQVHEAIKLFNKIDINGDGQITKEELYIGLRDFLETSGKKLKNQVEIIFNNIDTDHNGLIEYEEFIRAAVDKNCLLSTNNLKFVFDYFDRDKNGSITFDEIEQIFFINAKNKKDPKAKEQLLKCFEETDDNRDGYLAFDEFKDMTKKILKDN